MDERDYRKKRWHARGGAVVDLDECVNESGDFSEWVERLLNGE
ncbi:hypothetical protein SAMN06269185_1652 [Natronoarchaeum philippinense]|uniref:Uncharacterized protein n=1 Tax=Natronoarchaeum philippinense TaxID=558529 RepID=A0A285NS77_NATPI|nr:hypothetical protein [Natronoarchaeum philippinense]SNZ12360.1 hypothetical protein SAMN06269185_1652 [Natronoarchaeum philippinense]